MPCVPCGAHIGVRTTFYDAPATVWIWKLPRPEPFSKAVEFFEKAGRLVQGIAVPSWEYAEQRLRWQSRKDVDDNRNSTIDAYTQSIGIAESSLLAACDFCCGRRVPSSFTLPGWE